jgi:hypothetical protein
VVAKAKRDQVQRMHLPHSLPPRQVPTPCLLPSCPRAFRHIASPQCPKMSQNVPFLKMQSARTPPRRVRTTAHHHSRAGLSRACRAGPKRTHHIAPAWRSSASWRSAFPLRRAKSAKRSQESFCPTRQTTPKARQTLPNSSKAPHQLNPTERSHLPFWQSQPPRVRPFQSSGFRRAQNKPTDPRSRAKINAFTSAPRKTNPPIPNLTQHSGLSTQDSKITPTDTAWSSRTRDAPAPRRTSAGHSPSVERPRSARRRTGRSSSRRAGWPTRPGRCAPSWC